MQNLNAIPLSALRVIEAVARTGTLAGAAGELGVTPGALSQRLGKAEKALGQPLFLRRSTGLVPTAACARIAPRLTRAFTELSAALGELREEAETVLTIAVAPIFASRWLIWRIGRFNEVHPGISVRLVPSAAVVDLDRSEMDAGIRILPRRGAAPDNAVKLLDQRVFPVMSPALAKGVRTPDDLLRLPVIRENERLQGWGPWWEGMGRVPPVMPAGPAYEDASLCLDAAMMGQGVFMAWETLASDALDRGQVAAPFPERIRTGSTYWFAMREGAVRKTALLKFRDWLQEEIDVSIRQWRGA